MVHVVAPQRSRRAQVGEHAQTPAGDLLSSYYNIHAVLCAEHAGLPARDAEVRDPRVQRHS